MGQQWAGLALLPARMGQNRDRMGQAITEFCPGLVPKHFRRYSTERIINIFAIIDCVPVLSHDLFHVGEEYLLNPGQNICLLKKKL